MSHVLTDSSLLKVSFGGDQKGACDTGLPVLAGASVENVFVGARPAGRFGDFALFEMAGWRLGAASVVLTQGLEATTHQLYQDIFTATQGYHLARIWNYVPAINEIGPNGLENYRVFCRGRSLAFEQQHGANFKAAMPAASAVGCNAPRLTIVFAAAPGLPRHVENPRQVPAYEYPAEYGPRPPSFSRATIVPGSERATVFISGTASIRGHATIAPHGIQEQLACTLENLREISLACGLGPHLDAGGKAARHFKVYLRHPNDQPASAAVLEERLFTSADQVIYLRADICRAPLLVEVEATLFGVTGVH